MALLLLDLDGFKQVNDTLGHLAGDTLLKQVTERWSTLVRAEDTLARLGGDEFALFLPREGDPTRAGRIAERLVQVTNAPFIIDGHAVVVGVSIGVAIATDEHPDATELLRWADGAMYDAKRRRSSWSVYTTELDKPTGTPAESQRILTFPDPFRLTRIEA
jgi:diguanylate cyclase (GGDEF)-like protein